MYTVYETLAKLGVKDKTIITAFNKQDKVTEEEITRDFRADYIVNISAKTGAGILKLLEVAESALRERKMEIEGLYSYADMPKIQQIRKYGELLEEDYREDGIFIRAYVPANLYGKVKLCYDR